MTYLWVSVLLICKRGWRLSGSHPRAWHLTSTLPYKHTWELGYTLPSSLTPPLFPFAFSTTCLVPVAREHEASPAKWTEMCPAEVELISPHPQGKPQASRGQPFKAEEGPRPQSSLQTLPGQAPPFISAPPVPDTQALPHLTNIYHIPRPPSVVPEPDPVLPFLPLATRNLPLQPWDAPRITSLSRLEAQMQRL